MNNIFYGLEPCYCGHPGKGCYCWEERVAAAQARENERLAQERRREPERPDR